VLSLLEDLAEAALRRNRADKIRLMEMASKEFDLFNKVIATVDHTDRTLRSRAVECIGLLVKTTSQLGLSWRMALGMETAAVAPKLLAVVTGLLSSGTDSLVCTGITLAARLVFPGGAPRQDFPADWNNSLCSVVGAPLAIIWGASRAGSADEAPRMLLTMMKENPPKYDSLQPELRMQLDSLVFSARSQTAAAVAFGGFLKEWPAMLPSTVIVQLRDWAVSELSRQDSQLFQRARQALATLDLVGQLQCTGALAECEPGVAAVVMAAVSRAIQNPPSFQGQACMHTFLSAAMATLSVWWVSLCTRPTKGGSGGAGTTPALAAVPVSSLQELVRGRLADPRWEVRESVIGFLGGLIVGAYSVARPGCPRDDLEAFFASEAVLGEAWACREDSEPFVRAAVIDFISSLLYCTSNSSPLPAYVLGTVCGGEERFLETLVSMYDDTEAIVRRAVLALLERSLRAFTSHSTTASIDSVTALFKDAGQEGAGSRHDHMPVLRDCLHRASVDLDWEVKLQALRLVAFWCVTENGGADGMTDGGGASSSSSSKRTISSGMSGAASLEMGLISSAFEAFDGATILKRGCVDHDRLVRVRALEICKCCQQQQRQQQQGLSSTQTPYNKAFLAHINQLDFDVLTILADDERTTAEPPWEDLLFRKRLRRADLDSDESDSDDANALGCY
jgi:hypothetical protein